MEETITKNEFHVNGKFIEFKVKKGDTGKKTYFIINLFVDHFVCFAVKSDDKSLYHQMLKIATDKLSEQIRESILTEK